MDEFGKPIKVGALVLARWKRAPKYYNARVESIDYENNTCHLRYLDGDHDPCVPGSHIRMPQTMEDYFDDMIMTKRKAPDEIPLMDNPDKYYTLQEVVEHASNQSLVAILHWLNTIPDCPYPLRMEEFNYKYDENHKIVNATTGQRFHWAGQAHYDSLGDVVLEYIQQQLKEKYNLQELLLPNDPESQKLHRTRRVNIFHSPDLLTAKRICWLIQGSGPIRPGQWARALCINESLDIGAMFKYVEAAQARGYAVVILNPNGGLVEPSAQEEYDKYRQLRAEYFASRLKQARGSSEGVNPEETKNVAPTSLEPHPSYFRESMLQIPTKSPDSNDIDHVKLKEIILRAVGPEMSPGKRYFILDQRKDHRINQSTAESKPHRHISTKSASSGKLAPKIAIPGHGDRETHTCTVYEELISKAQATEHTIIAQGAGGYSVLSLLKKHHTTLLPVLRSIAFTDSVHEIDEETPAGVVKFLQTNAVNWVASLGALDAPEHLHRGLRNSGCVHVSAGTKLHEYTPGSAFEAVWRFIDSRSIDNPNGVEYPIPEMKPPVVFKRKSYCNQS